MLLTTTTTVIINFVDGIISRLQTKW